MKFCAVQLVKAFIILIAFVSCVQAESRQSQLSSNSESNLGAKLQLAPQFAGIVNQFDSSAKRGNRLAKIGWTFYDNKKDSSTDLSFKVRAGVASSLKNPSGGLVFLLGW